MPSLASQKVGRGWSRSRIKGLIIRIVLAYAVLIVAMMALENKLVYHPVGAENWHESPDPRTKDVYVTSATGERIHGWFLPHPSAKSVFLYAHGNAGNLSHRGHDATVWAHELNVSVLMYDYPGFGKSTGNPTESGCYAAADAMWHWLTQDMKVPPRNIILFGKSLGGAMAVELASRHDHRALVLARSFISLPEAGADRYWFVPVRWLARAKFPNLEKLPNCQRPTFIYHGAHDTIVTDRHAYALYDAAADPKELLIDPVGTHVGSYHKDIFSRLRSFLDRYAPD